eukprot:scaffold5581_cov156-Skeletonema_marinoi.AAC.2
MAITKNLRWLPIRSRSTRCAKTNNTVVDKRLRDKAKANREEEEETDSMHTLFDNLFHCWGAYEGDADEISNDLVKTRTDEKTASRAQRVKKAAEAKKTTEVKQQDAAESKEAAKTDKLAQEDVKEAIGSNNSAKMRAVGGKGVLGKNHAFRSFAIGKKRAAGGNDVPEKDPEFRLVLQTLHGEKVVNEEALFEWVEERKEEGKDGSESALFWQHPTQEFLELLQGIDEDFLSDEDTTCSGMTTCRA